jgi:nucleoside-diphosphate-sugar epimerase
MTFPGQALTLLNVRILLTGALGNVGSHTRPELEQQGHEVRGFDLRDGTGDITDPASVKAAVAGVDTVIHLAAMIPPDADEKPSLARAINVGGTANVIAACQESSARLLFISTLDVHGITFANDPPRHVDDPLEATNPYTEHKIECEQMVRDSGLDWAIFRLADVPVLGMRAPHPIMFEIGLHNRIECIHASDVGLAIANAMKTPDVWGQVHFIGGGPSCQMTYGGYLDHLLTAMGVNPLPRNAFSTADYCTDWLDTSESEALLHYQRHTFNDIAEAIASTLGWRRRLVPLVRPLARRSMLRLSPYYSR